ALREVLVGRADPDALDARVGRRDRGGRGEPVVGLVLHERPHREARGGERLLERLELGAQRRIDPRAGLVAGVEVVAERFDHVVAGDADVRGALLEQPDQRREHAAQRAHLLTVRTQVRGHREEVAEQLVGAVDQVDLHAPRSYRGYVTNTWV